MNTHEMLAREKKASALIDAMEKHGWAELAPKMNAAHWAVVAGYAKVKPPSAETIKVVLERLRNRGKV